MTRTEFIQKPQAISLNLIEEPILDYVVVSQLDVDRMIKAGGPLPIVTLAQVDEKLYPIGGFAALEVAKQRLDNTVQCIVCGYDTVQEAVRAGLIQCSVIESINPLKAPEIMKFFGGDIAENIKTINMGGMQLEKMLNAHIIPEIYDKLTAVVAQLSSRLSAQTLTVPTQFLIAFSRANQKKQLAVWDRVYDLIDFKCSESQFTWPNTNQILLVIRQTDMVDDEESVAMNIDVEPDVTREDEESVVAHLEGVEPQESDATLQILKQYKNGIVLPQEDGSHIVVNTKNKSLEKLTQTADGLNFDSIQIEGQPAYIVPPSVVKHLGIEENEIHSKEFDGLDDAKKHLTSLPSTTKLAMFWTT